jgi:hypothetical protein
MYRLDRYIHVRMEGSRVCWQFDESTKATVERLDGCYVVTSNLPPAAATTAQLHARYMALCSVERDVRTVKTGALELRPIFLRKASRTRGHALVTLLALRLYRALDARIAPPGLTVQDAIERLAAVRLVSLADPAMNLWRLPDRYAPAQTELLAVLPALPTPCALSPKDRPSRRLTNPRKGRPPK